MLVLPGLTLLLSLSLNVSQAQVPPITSSGLNTQVSGPIPINGKTQFNITGGTRPGGGINLFHSFGNFNVPNNNIANFLNETALPTSNILGRVTGGNISNIFGTIQTTGFGSANLFLMNPAGFLFGPNATVNVGGMVAFTSADYLRLADGVRFNAIPDAAADALLSTAPVAAYGFLGSNPGAITVQGSQFTVTEGTGISLVGGNITIESGTPDGGTAQPARLSASNGAIQLASAASPGEFDAATLQSLPNADGASFSSFGSVTLAPSSTINISGTNEVSIRGGQFVLSVNDAVLSTAEGAGPPETISLSPTSSIISSNAGADPGVDVLLTASDVRLDGSPIRSTTTGEGAGGAISLDAQTISLTNGAQIVTGTEGAGDGGNITISATDSVSISGYDTTGTLSGVTTFLSDPVTFLPLVSSGIFTTASSTGNGGNVSITTRAVTLENGGTGATITSGDGRGGNFTLAADTVDIRNAGTLQSFNGIDLTTFEPMGTGQGGDITIAATDSVRLSEFNPDLFASGFIFSQAGNTAKGGDVAITAPNVTLDSGGSVAAFGSGEAPAGSVSIQAPNTFSISGIDEFGNPSQLITFTEQGAGGSINIQAGSVSITDAGLVLTGSFGSGNSGDISVQADQGISITGGAVVGTSGGGTSSGNISLTADAVLISGVSGFSRSRVESINGGEAATGNISIHAREVTVTDNARINSEGANGREHIELSATESVMVSDGAKIRMVNESGSGGLVEISAPTVMMQQGVIQTETVGAGDAGAIDIHADNLKLDGSFINGKTSSGIGRGGDVTIAITETLSITGMFNGSETDSARPAGIYTETSLDFGDGAAGRVMVTARTAELSSGATITSNTFGAGNAGDVTLKADSVIIEGGAKVTSGSVQRAPFFEGEEVPVPTGNAGSVTVLGLASPAQSVFTDGAGSGIFTETQGTGAGGNISVSANSVTLQNGAHVSSSSTGTGTDAGRAGDITINAGNQFAMTNSAVTTEADQSSGGAIKITTNPNGTVQLTDSLISASVSDGTSGGGSVNIDPQFVLLQNSQIRADAKSGPGGNIFITTNLLLQDATSIISASSQFGQQGTITIQSPIAPASGKIVPLSQKPLVPTSLLSQRCAALAGGNFSSFTMAGRDSLPAEPGSWLSSPLPLTTLSGGTGLAATGEAQGVVREETREAGGEGLEAMTLGGGERREAGGDGEGLSSSFGLFGLFRAFDPMNEMNQTNQIDQTDEPPVLSLRQIAPPGFLTQAFAADWSTGCTS
jgi:filamentous hemagglutinin family protein